MSDNKFPGCVWSLGLWCARINIHDVIFETPGLFVNLNGEGCHQPCLLLCLYRLVLLFKPLGLPLSLSVFAMPLLFLIQLEAAIHKVSGVLSWLTECVQGGTI